MRILAIVIVLLGFWVVSCNDCNNCEPFTEEPNVLVRFYNFPDTSSADTTRRVIIIDSVNLISTESLRHFNDTTHSFKFPLDMNNDISEFKLVYRDTSDLGNYLTNTVTIAYNREFVRRDDNYIVVQCDITNFNSDFTDHNLECKESDNNQCISNDAKASLYN